MGILLLVGSLWVLVRTEGVIGWTFTLIALYSFLLMEEGVRILYWEIRNKMRGRETI